MTLAHRAVRFAKRNSPAICQDQVDAAADDLFVQDDTSDLERVLVGIGFQKGAISQKVYDVIMKAIDAGK